MEEHTEQDVQKGLFEPEPESAEAEEGLRNLLNGQADGQADAHSIIEATIEKCTAPLGQEIEQLGQQVRDMTQQLAALPSELEEARVEQRVLTEMHDRCRELTEQHHQREILQPLFMTLIGMADRSRQKAARLVPLLEQHAGQLDHPAVQAMRHLREARRADCVEVEGVLAVYGAEPFQHPGHKFDPSTQKCMRRVECDDPAQHTIIAERLRPGYRRDGIVLRQEFVTVYVCPRADKAPKQEN